MCDLHERKKVRKVTERQDPGGRVIERRPRTSGEVGGCMRECERDKRIVTERERER